MTTDEYVDTKTEETVGPATGTLGQAGSPHVEAIVPLPTGDPGFTGAQQEETRPPSSFDLAALDPLASLHKAEEVVRYMSAKCAGPRYISNIQGRNYPKVDWWTTVGMGFGLFPVEVSNERVEREDGEVLYVATVEVRHAGQVVTRASAMCSNRERTWARRDEYALRSMAATRATGKAYRIGLSGLAVMAGLEPTPAEEMPTDGATFESAADIPGPHEVQRGLMGPLPVDTAAGHESPGRDLGAQDEDTGYGVCKIHNVAYFMKGKMKSPAHKDGDRWCNKPSIKTEVAEQLKGLFPDHTERRQWVAKQFPELEGRSPLTFNDAEWEAIGKSLDAEKKRRSEPPAELPRGERELVGAAASALEGSEAKAPANGAAPAKGRR